MPHLSNPKVIAAMTRAVFDVSQTRSVLNALGPCPNHKAVDTAKAKLALIDSSLFKKLEDLDTLKEAKGGDTAMQVLVGQMYLSGYGVEKNPEKGHAWISRASRSRRAIWKVSQKQPGYHASDSDSNELEDVAK
ncbi:hypothetical protein ACLB2K_020207 [Fragaria x ananassa]